MSVYISFGLVSYTRMMCFCLFVINANSIRKKVVMPIAIVYTLAGHFYEGNKEHESLFGVQSRPYCGIDTMVIVVARAVDIQFISIH